jgi:hypothetical protein
VWCLFLNVSNFPENEFELEFRDPDEEDIMILQIARKYSMTQHHIPED